MDRKTIYFTTILSYTYDLLCD